MAKVTSKLQVTIPKWLAEEYGIEPGDEIEWVPAGASIRIVPAERRPERLNVEQRLAIFDQATERLGEWHRERRKDCGAEVDADRGWTREELYGRGGSD